MTDRAAKAVSEIIAKATAAAHNAETGAEALMAAITMLAEIDQVEDLGAFALEGQKPGDPITTRRLKVAGRIFRVLVWPECAE